MARKAMEGNHQIRPQIWEPRERRRSHCCHGGDGNRAPGSLGCRNKCGVKDSVNRPKYLQPEEGTFPPRLQDTRHPAQDGSFQPHLQGIFLFFFTTETRLKSCHTPGNSSAAICNGFRATLASIQGGQSPIFALRSSGVGSAECVWTFPAVKLGTQQGSEPTPETLMSRLIVLISQHSSQRLQRPLHLLKHTLKRQKH